MRRVAALVAAAGLVAVAIAGISVRGRLRPADAVMPGQPPQQSADAGRQVAPQPPAPLPPVTERVRPVAPEIVATPPVDHATLERVEARGPLSEIGAARSPSEGPPAETILFRPLATGGGTFTSLGYEITLAGIIPTSVDETCVSDGVSWPCGIHARTAFRNWLRGRALTCVVPPVPTGDVVVSRCLLGTRDAAAWLVSFGWAKALPDSGYAQLEEEARAELRGMFGPAPAVPVAVAAPEFDNEPSPEMDPAPTVAEPVDNGSRPFVSEPLPDAFGLSGG